MNGQKELEDLKIQQEFYEKAKIDLTKVQQIDKGNKQVKEQLEEVIKLSVRLKMTIRDLEG